MKKLMLSTAVAALALAITPAMAQDGGVKLNLGGHFKGYANYSDQDTSTDAGDEVNTVDFLRSTEVHFGGETALDNGLTVGAQIETLADDGESFEIDESYVYMSGSWGRVNLGSEDGAAYLLQVAAPSADDNIDGIRQFINPVNYTVTALNGQTAPAVAVNPALATIQADLVDYDNDLARGDDKITYLSPIFSGFQAGVSYTPDVTSNSRGVNGNVAEVANGLSDAYEAGVRYETSFNNVGVIAGAGYTHGNLEATGAGVVAGQDDYKEWNVGLDLDIGAFGLGAVYTENNVTEAVTAGPVRTGDNETWVVGADYTTGPFKLGVSYLNNEIPDSATTTLETDRYTGGVTYTYGPGMTFRGSVSMIEHDSTVAGQDTDSTNVLVGTQINF
jgi:outer membrane protein OmpU